MGYMRHHAIIVSSWSDAYIGDAYRQALKVFEGIAPVSEIVPSPVNGYRSFLVATDGSKEGWEHSDRGDAARAAFVAWLNAARYEDGSTSLKWAEIQYGDDEGYNLMLAHDAAGKLRDATEEGA